MIETRFKKTSVGLIPEDWCVISLGTIGEPCMCKRIMKHQTNLVGDVPFFKIGTFGAEPDAFISRQLFEEFKHKYHYPKVGDVLISAAGTIGRSVVYNGQDAYYQDSNIVWLDNDEKLVTNEYLSLYYKIIKWATTDGGTITRLYNKNIRDSIIIVPSLIEEQNRIASAFADMDALISDLEALIEKKRNIKQGAMQELLSGKRRLAGFTEAWANIPLGEILSYEQPTKYLVHSENYSDSGTPVLTAGKSFVLGYTNESDGIYDKVPVIIFDDFVTESKFVDFAFKVKSSAVKMLQVKNENYNLRLIYEIMQNISFYAPEHKRYWISRYSHIIVSVPSTIEEQNAIAEVLGDMDEEISTLQARLDKYKQLKQGMMQQLLTGRIRLI